MGCRNSRLRAFIVPCGVSWRKINFVLRLRVLLIAVAALVPCALWAQPQPGAARPTAFPSLVDITAATGVQFNHLSTPEQRYIVESMSGGVALIDYDRDGYPDIYFTNAQSVAMAMNGKKAKAALYHNNHDGTFTDVTDKAGLAIHAGAWGLWLATITTMDGRTYW